MCVILLFLTESLGHALAAFKPRPRTSNESHIHLLYAQLMQCRLQDVKCFGYSHQQRERDRYQGFISGRRESAIF